MTAGNWLMNIVGAGADGSSNLFTKVANNFKALQAESNLYRLGLNYSKELTKATTLTTWASRLGGTLNLAGFAFANYNYQNSDKSWGDKAQLGMNGVIFGLSLTPHPVAVGIGIGLGFAETGGAFGGMYQTLDAGQNYYKFMGGGR
jgi:hypothetical protein